MRQTNQLQAVHLAEYPFRDRGSWHLRLALILVMLSAGLAPEHAAGSAIGSDEESPLGPVDSSSASSPTRGYMSRPCGFDLDDDGLVGEPADCNVCDASLSGGKVLANTTDPDADGVEEDLIYVDCDGGSNFNYCGRPGFRPCRTIDYAWDAIADGPGDGAEDIVCFTGTCSPDAFRLPEAYNGVPGHWTKSRSGSEARDWEFPRNPAMLVGWDTDNDGIYPPFDSDDTSVLDGTGIRHAFKLNALTANSYYEMAHFEVHDYGDHSPDADGSGGFVNMFTVVRESTHGHLHDLSLRGINKDAALYSPKITFSWFNAGHSSFIALTNIESLEEGSYTFRGSADINGQVIAGPWRFQNLTITAHGCDKHVCEGRAAKNPWKFWGWVDGVEILDSIIDANVAKWTPQHTVAIAIDANTRDWDIINNEIIDFMAGVYAVGKIPDGYSPVKRYTDDIVVSGNLIRNVKQDRSISVWINYSGGNKQAVGNAWILNNTMTSSLFPKAHVLIRHGNTDGPSVTNVRIFNNTLFGKADDSVRVVDNGDAYRVERVRFTNNIVAGQSPQGTSLEVQYSPIYWESDSNVFDSKASLVFDGVAYSGIEDWRVATGGDQHSVGCKPSFRSPPFDLHLVGDDVCAREKGVALSWVTQRDFELEARPYGPRWDIGSDEFSGGFFWDSLESGDLALWSEYIP